MAAKVVGLCLLVLGTTGLAMASTRYFKRIPHYDRHFQWNNHFLDFENNPIDHYDYEDVFKFFNGLTAVHPSKVSGFKSNLDGPSAIIDSDPSVQSVSPRPVATNVLDGRISDVHLNAGKEEHAVQETSNERYATSNAGPASATSSPFLHSDLNVQSQNNQHVKDAGNSLKSEHDIETSATSFSQSTFQKTTMDAHEISDKDFTTLNPESNNSAPSKNAKVTDVQNISSTVEPTTRMRNVSDNIAASSTAEIIVGKETSEIASTTGFTDDDKTLSTGKTGTPMPEEITTNKASLSDVSSDNSFSQATTASGERTESSTPYRTEGEEIQVAINQTTISSKTETSDSISLTSEKDASDSNTLTTEKDDSNTLATEKVITDSNTLTTEKDITDSNTLTTEKDITDSNTLTTEKDLTDSNTLTTGKDLTDSNTLTTEEKFSVSLSTATDEAIPFTTLSSHEFKSTKSEFITESIPQDHIIRIQSIRTARMVISVVFIVIALVAVTVVAIYMFRVKRRAAHYDQLMLLP